MTKIIKKEGKFYRQMIEEDEIILKDLEENLVDIIKRKDEFIVEHTKNFDDQINELQNEINQIKTF